MSTRAAFRTTALVNDFQGKIESVAYYSQRVLIGTSDGRLVLYDMRRGQSGPVASIALPNRRKIDDIIVIPHVRSVLVLSEGQITVHAATDLEPLPSEFTMARNVRTLCVNQRGPPHYRVCAAVRRKLMLFEFGLTKEMKQSGGKDRDKQYVFLREFMIADTPEVAAWYRNKLVLGYRKEYHIMNDKTGEALSVVGVSPDVAKGAPVVKLLPGEEILLTTLDKLGVWIDFTAQPLQKNSISWSNAPSKLSFTSPYLIALIDKAGIEIHSMKDHSVVQFISLPRVCALFGNGMKWDMEPRPQGDPEDVILVATSNPSCVYRLDAMPMDQQIGDLLDRGEVEEARELMKHSVSNLSGEKQRSKMRKFDRQCGVALLRRLQFRAAVDYLYRGDLDPRELLVFFPEYHGRSFAYEPTVLKPDTLPRTGSAPDITGVISEAQRRRVPTDMNSRQLLNEASIALMMFLEMHAKSDGRQADARMQRCINNALFRLYVVHDRKKELKRFLKDEESVADIELSEAKSLLSRHHMYGARAALCVSLGLHDEALEGYSLIGSGENEDSSVDPIVETVKVLSRVEDEALVWKYSEWILRRSPSEGLSLLSERKPRLESQAVLEHLKAIDAGLAQRYLEQMVETEPDDESTAADEAHHTGLALEYLDEVVRLHKAGEKLSNSNPGSESGAMGKARKRLLKFLKGPGSNYDAAQLLSKTKRHSALQAEFIILCGRSGKHKEALQILIEDRRRPEAAEEYCLTYGIPKGENTNVAFLHLLRMYFQPEDEAQRATYRDAGFLLLSRHARRLNAQAVVELLPDDTSLTTVYDFLSQALPNSVHQVRETMVRRNLSNMYNLEMQCRQVEAAQKSVTVYEDTVCMVCRKRIGDLVFAFYPNGTIVHYNCTHAKLDVCPVTGENFS